jgi:hypothetical protein
MVVRHPCRAVTGGMALKRLPSMWNRFGIAGGEGVREAF